MFLSINDETPNPRHIKQVVECLKKDGVIIYPTDSVYAMGCSIFSQKAITRLCQIKGQKAEKTKFSFLCKDLSEAASYAKQIDNEIFRVMKRCLPGPYTFILNASALVPKIIQGKKKTVGIRVPNNQICIDIINVLGHPIITTSIKMGEEEDYPTDPWELHEAFENQVDMVVDGGFGQNDGSTVLDCTQSEIEIIREGLGPINNL